MKINIFLAMKNAIYKITQNIFGFFGPKSPSRTDCFLDCCAKWGAGLLTICKGRKIHKGNQKRKIFLLKKKIYTFYYGNQILRTAKSIGKQFYCGGPSRVNANTIIKDYVCFNGMFINGGGKVTIGSYFHSGIECMIITSNHDYNTGQLIPYGVGYNSPEVVIEDFVWLGRRVTILPGSKIGEGAIIQAGAVVHGEIPAYAIAGGNPAKPFKYRDIEHFKKLKSEGKVLSNEMYCKYAFPSE